LKASHVALATNWSPDTEPVFCSSYSKILLQKEAWSISVSNSLELACIFRCVSAQRRHAVDGPLTDIKSWLAQMAQQQPHSLIRVQKTGYAKQQQHYCLALQQPMGVCASITTTLAALAFSPPAVGWALQCIETNDCNNINKYFSNFWWGISRHCRPVHAWPRSVALLKRRSLVVVYAWAT
jgi:hypothetical protein